MAEEKLVETDAPTISRVPSIRTLPRDRYGQGKEPSETAAVRQAQQGDGAAFEHLYRLHSRRVYALCLRMAGNPAEAEEWTQEAFLQLFRRIQTFRGESAFSTWLHRLCVNVVLMRLRKRKLSETSPEEMTRQDQEAGDPRKEIGRPDLLLTGTIDRLHLERAMKRLPRGYKTVFLLHDVEGYRHHEIGEILGCAAENSKSQLRKARLRLRELLWKPGREGHLKRLAALRLRHVFLS